MGTASENNHLIKKQAAKRCFDLVVLCLLLSVFSPLVILLLVIMLLDRMVDLDFGPLLIYEKRTSKGRVFNLMKLNMYRERARKHYIRTSQEYRQFVTYAYLQQDKNSLTRFGRVMKKYYLDELGQLINIFWGDMSFVGPRPLPVGYETTGLAPRREQKSGLVGFTATRWKNGQQVNAIQADEEYLHIYKAGSVSELIITDLKVLRDAIRAVFKGKGL